jgi:formin 2/WAS/WASL-interacting protein
MGFLDKAKKLAEQAQTKLDEVQQQINQQGSPQQGGSGPVTHYDQHGRPIPPEQTTSPPHGDPLRGQAPPPPPAPPAPPAPGVPPTAPSAPVEGTSVPPPAPPGVPAAPSSPPIEGQTKPPAMPGAPAAEEDRNHPSYAPPKLTSGDPLAG